ncbi:MAG: NAD-dependent epimerase/dehydratase family protein [Candidatus Alcyoniella australis]|nr:NAD-dependent epimerase/dehydratase family protein [Candidatus Alcyoniella australis]
MNNPGKALVTGADGLLGSYLVRELLEANIAVRVLRQPNSKSPTLDGLKIESQQADLLGPAADLERAVDGCDCVFHLAAITDQWAPDELIYNVNLEGTHKLLDACLTQGIKRLVFCGSASSYQSGTIERPGDESGGFPEQYRGIAYMESKHRASALVKQYVDEHGLDAVICAPTFMLGLYDSRPSSGELIKQFVEKQLLFASAGGRNFAHARDVARGMLGALLRGTAGRSYILGGRNMSYFDFFSAVARIAHTRPPKVVLPGALVLTGGALAEAFGKLSGKKVQLNRRIARLSLIGSYYSSQRAIDELEMPQTDVEQSIEDSLTGLKQYGHLR